MLVAASAVRAALPSPLGDLVLVTRGGALLVLDFADNAERVGKMIARLPTTPEPGIAPATLMHALSAYFAGDPGAVAALPCAAVGTPFQRAVWEALRSIPAGRTLSYAALAAALERPAAYRAVGAAVGANPISIVVPCHRVVGTGGRLTGYAGGLERKRWLLALEAKGA